MSVARILRAARSHPVLVEIPSGVKMRTQFLGNPILGRHFFTGAPKVCSFA